MNCADEEMISPKMYYIFVIDGSSYMAMYECMLSDLKGDPYSIVIADEKKIDIVNNLLKKRKIRNVIGDKLDFLVREDNVLCRSVKEAYKEHRNICVVFFNGALYHNSYLPYTLLRYKEKWNIKFVLFYLDIVGTGVSLNADYLRSKNVFDIVYTVDPGDAKKYNLIQFLTTYSKEPSVNVSENVNVDLYFCGASKNRSPIIKKLVEAGSDYDVKMKMDIICYEDKEVFKRLNGITVHDPGDNLPYNEVLRRQINANCMLDIVQENQSALTLRAYEAVVYGKKLLTNNIMIKDFPFFNNTYMRCFEKMEDIDWEWVKKREKVDYHYNGEFSPRFLIKDIASRLNKSL